MRGAVGLSLALIVANTDEIPRAVQEIVLFHVGGVALLTLLINATTTGKLVMLLGLSKQTDFEKSILHGMTERLNRSVDENIGVLRQKRHFNHVEWEKIKSEVDMHELRNSLKRFKNLKVEGDQSQAVANIDMGHKTGQL